MARPFYMLDIESLATAQDAQGKSFIAMPNFAFVYVNSEGQYSMLYGQLPVQDQLNAGAVVGASTLAFWMTEAANGNDAATNIIAALSGKGSIIRVEPDGEGEYHVLRFSEPDTRDVLRETALFFKDHGDAPVLGNGPEFDNVIFEAVHRAMLPNMQMLWKFWSSGSARTYKDMAIEKGHYVKNIQKDATLEAIAILDALSGQAFSARFVTSKHDPLLDALAEAITVQKIKAII
ncbi:metallopeptidase [Serratia phage Slocum]|nr:metallopeptidase [Serratia phage Slocum]